jgi:hypothetical protein
MKEALKLALETLESSRVFVMSREAIKQPEGENWYDSRITAIKEALAQPEQEPVARVIDNGTPEGATEWIPFANRIEPLKTGDLLYTHAEERNFCPRCGKRTADPTTIHTCTPPQIDPNQWAFDNGLEST